MNREVAIRLQAVIEDLHRAANPPPGVKPTTSELKRDIRQARNSLRQLIEEFTI